VVRVARAGWGVVGLSAWGGEVWRVVGCGDVSWRGVGGVAWRGVC